MADLKQSNSLPLLYIYHPLMCEDRRTWSETRTASPEELDEAEKALHKLKQIVGYCKPYDRHCHNAIGSVEDILRNVERNAGKAAMMASKFEPKSVTFDPRYFE
jgi:hypothetical protein